MSVYGNNGVEQIGNDAPSGMTVGQTKASLVGFHGKTTTQGLTGTYLGTTGIAGTASMVQLPMDAGSTGIVLSINNLIQLLRDKGLEREFV